jgi:hypothetical protein
MFSRFRDLYNLFCSVAIVTSTSVPSKYGSKTGMAVGSPRCRPGCTVVRSAIATMWCHWSAVGQLDWNSLTVMVSCGKPSGYYSRLHKLNTVTVELVVTRLVSWHFELCDTGDILDFFDESPTAVFMLTKVSSYQYLQVLHWISASRDRRGRTHASC